MQESAWLAFAVVSCTCLDWGLEVGSAWSFCHPTLWPFALVDLTVCYSWVKRNTKRQTGRLIPIIALNQFILLFTDWLDIDDAKITETAVAQVVISIFLQDLLRSTGVIELRSKTISDQLERWFAQPMYSRSRIFWFCYGLCCCLFGFTLPQLAAQPLIDWLMVSQPEMDEAPLSVDAGLAQMTINVI
jgi:hypothetical protein